MRWFCSHFSFGRRRNSNQTLSLTILLLCLESHFFTIKNESFDIKEASVKSRKKIPSVFESKDSIRLSPLYGLVQKHKCRRYHSSYYDEGDRYLNVNLGKHISFSLLAFRKKNLAKKCFTGPSFKEFN